jgi:ketosteroid isomerase-like protein
MVQVTHELLNNFYDACISRDAARIGPLLDDDVEWLLTGPVEVISYCGRRKGRAAAVEMLVQGRDVIVLNHFDFDHVLIAGDHAATLSWFVGTEPKSGRPVKFRCSHFLRFRDGKVISFRAVRDTFSFVEQVIGHPLDLGPESAPELQPGDGNDGHA